MHLSLFSQSTIVDTLVLSLILLSSHILKQVLISDRVRWQRHSQTTDFRLNIIYFHYP